MKNNKELYTHLIQFAYNLEIKFRLKFWLNFYIGQIYMVYQLSRAICVIKFHAYDIKRTIYLFKNIFFFLFWSSNKAKNV